MKFKNKIKSAISTALAVIMLMGTVPITTTFAAQVNEYTDPADSWISANGRTNELDVNATTTYETQYCLVCDKETTVLTYRVSTTHEHDYRYLETVPASCENLGYERWQCDGCGELVKMNYSQALGHNHKGIVIKEPTCKQGGLTLYMCSNCGDFFEETTATGEHSYEAHTHNPTCQSVGYTENKCAVCDYSYLTNITPLVSHSYERITKEMQRIVGGDIQAVHLNRDPVVVVCNENGKILGLELNRALKNDSGKIVDVLVGTFFICGKGEENFCSLTPDMADKYKKMFYYPDMFIQANNGLVVIPTKLCQTSLSQPRAYT